MAVITWNNMLRCPYLSTSIRPSVTGPLHTRSLYHLRQHNLVPLYFGRKRDLRCCSAEVSNPQSAPVNLEEGLQKLDRLLGLEGESGEGEAVSLATALKESGVLKGFGNGRQIPKRTYTLDELRLNKIEPEKFLSPNDNTLNTVRTVLQGAALAGLTALFFGTDMQLNQLLALVVAGLFAVGVDQVAYGGGLEALALDTVGRVLAPSYAKRVAFHESGHFLVAYLVGLLPRAYTLSSLDAFQRSGTLNVQAGTLFCDGAFQREVAGGRLSSSSLERYCCVALAGVATEYVTFGRAEGGLADVRQLDGLLRALQFTQLKADAEIRWAVLNTTSILRRHAATHAQLAEAMERGESVGRCIGVIERALAGSDDV